LMDGRCRRVPSVEPVLEARRAWAARPVQTTRAVGLEDVRPGRLGPIEPRGLVRPLAPMGQERIAGKGMILAVMPPPHRLNASASARPGLRKAAPINGT